MSVTSYFKLEIRSFQHLQSTVERDLKEEIRSAAE